MSSAGVRPLRIGELAERTGVTPRTIRYYEEIGLLTCGERRKGEHRTYAEADAERILELTRLRDLLGLSLEELARVVEAEEARAAIRRRFHESASDEERLRLLEEALPHVEAQLGLVRRRRDELAALEDELLAKRKLIHTRRRELGG